MAITSTITDELTGNELPTVSHAPNAVTKLTGSVHKTGFSTKISSSGNTDANLETAYDNFEADLKTWVDGTFLPSDVGIDVAQTITAVIYVSRFYPEASDLSDATQEYVMEGRVEWKVG